MGCTYRLDAYGRLRRNLCRTSTISPIITCVHVLAQVKKIELSIRWVIQPFVARRYLDELAVPILLCFHTFFVWKYMCFFGIKTK